MATYAVNQHEYRITPASGVAGAWTAVTGTIPQFTVGDIDVPIGGIQVRVAADPTSGRPAGLILTNPVAFISAATGAAAANTPVPVTAVPLGSTVFLVMEGDSMTITTLPGYGNTHPEQLLARIGSVDYPVDASGLYFNDAVASSTSASVLARIGPLKTRLAAECAKASVGGALVSLRIGIFDIANSGLAGQAVFSNISNFVSQVKAVSPKVKVILGTLPNQNYSATASTNVPQTTINSEVANLNALIRGSISSLGLAGVWDSQAATQLQDFTNATYFANSLILSAAGSAVEAALEAAVIAGAYTIAAKPAGALTSAQLIAANPAGAAIGNYATRSAVADPGFASGVGGAVRGVRSQGPYPAGYDTTKPRVVGQFRLGTLTQIIFGLRETSDTGASFDGAGYSIFVNGSSYTIRGADWSGGSGAAGGSIACATTDKFTFIVDAGAIYLLQNGVEQYRKTAVDTRSFRLHANFDNGFLYDLEEGTVNLLAS